MEETKSDEIINQKHLSDYIDFITDKPQITNYKEITNYPRKTYFTKLRYKFPSLVKQGFNKVTTNLNLDIKAPILEENAYLNKRNNNLFSIRSVLIDKDKINKGFERKLPSFCPCGGNKYLIEQKQNEKNEIRLLKKSYENYSRTTKERGGSTTEKFFKDISRNILQNKFFVRNMKGSVENIDKSSLFITRNQKNYSNDISKNNNLSVNDSNFDQFQTNEKRFNDSKFNRNIGKSHRDNNSYDLKYDKNYQDIVRTEKIIKRILSSDY